MEKADLNVVRKIAKKHIERIELIRESRETGKQDIGFNSRPFVLCGLPLRRPPKGQFIHRRKNSDIFLRIVGDPEYGLPFGQDRLIPIWIASLAFPNKTQTVRFRSAAEILRTFDLPNNGKAYRRLMEGFRRIFASTMFFGNDKLNGDIFSWTRFHYFDAVRLWFSNETDQPTLEGEEFENVIRLSDTFWRELNTHPIPIDMNVVREFASAPGILDLYMWLTWRCWCANRPVGIPLFGENGLSSQLGMAQKDNYKFRQTLNNWLKRIRASWPDCPAALTADGEYMMLDHAEGIKDQLPAPAATGTIP